MTRFARRAAWLAIVATFASITAAAQVQLPPSHNSNPTKYGPPAAQFFSACSGANAINGAPLTNHVTWIWSTGGGGIDYCAYLTTLSQIGTAGHGGRGYAVGDVITLVGNGGYTTTPAAVVVTKVSPTVRAVTAFIFDSPAGGSAGVFYAPYPTIFRQSQTTGTGVGFVMTAPRYAAPKIVAPVPNVNSGGYWPIYWDNGTLSNCNLACWRGAHPDWIAYACDRQTPAFYQRVSVVKVAAQHGSPTITMTPSQAAQLNVGWGALLQESSVVIGLITGIDAAAGIVTLDTNFADVSGQYSVAFANPKPVPLNWTNPLVYDYMMKWAAAYINGGSGDAIGTATPEILTAGFASIDFDVVNVYNTSGFCGYYAGAQPGKGSPPSYGGQWTQLFSGLTTDSVFPTAAIQLACSLTAGVHALADSEIFTVGNVAGAAYDGGPAGIKPSTYVEPMIACFDLWADESSFFDCKAGPAKLTILTGVPFQRALTTTLTMNSAQYWADVTYLCQSVGTPAAKLTTFEAAGEVWASAVYYLLQAPPAAKTSYWGMIGYTLAIPIDHGRYVPYDPSWFPIIGTPTEQAHVNAGGCYERHYTSGLVELNSGTSACSFIVPSGAVDQFGNAVTSGSLRPLPVDRTKIACSTPNISVATCSALVMTTSP